MPTPVHTRLPARAFIGKKLKALRESRRWSQSELAERLGISQARLSLIENGKASLDAEELLEVLRIFNVPASDFDPKGRSNGSDALQNALARQGARHLLENQEAIPASALEDPEILIRQVLADGTNPRQVAALAPVLVQQVGRINAPRLWTQFVSYGIQRRIGWLLENTVQAIEEILPQTNDRSQAGQLRQARNHYQHLLANVEILRAKDYDHAPADILGQAYSARTLEADKKAASSASARWGIVSKLQPQDFAKSLEASFEAH